MHSTKQSYDICIVGLKCRDLLMEVEKPKYLGGIEKMLVTLAKALTESGKKVAFITYGKEKEPVTHQNIDIFSVFSEQEGIRGIRNIHPRLTGFYRVMNQINSPVYVQMGAGVETAMTCLVARLLLRKRMAYCVASDSDCMNSTPLVFSKIEAMLYKLGLRFANLRVSQTTSQRDMLTKNFSLSSVIIPMPHIPFQSEESTRVATQKEVLWVGRPVPGKRLEMLVDVAERHPNINFHMVGADNNDTEYSRNVLARAEITKNIEVHGKTSESKLQSLYQTCTILACTSEIEGFPATFMEAWSYGKPVITTFDPDGIVANHRLGLVCSNAQEFSERLTWITDNQDEYDSLSRSAQDFYSKNFTAAAVIPAFIAHFEAA